MILLVEISLSEKMTTQKSLHTGKRSRSRMGSRFVEQLIFWKRHESKVVIAGAFGLIPLTVHPKVEWLLTLK